jgi:putative RecB family exonuclease
MTELRNPHLSYSRLSRFEQCPLAYQLHYIDRKQPERGIPVRFGTAIHVALERLIREVVDREYVGPLSEQRAVEHYRTAWNFEGLIGLELFQEGLKIIKDFVRAEGHVNHRNILAVEKEFELAVGRFTVLGYIDRVDYVDDETIRIVDYKSNRQLFTRDDVDFSLQMSLYQLAARQLWPWVKKIELSFWMLRHGLRQDTTRTEEQLEAAVGYVQALGEQLETATDFPARLNPNCTYCDHRKSCPAYAEALAGKREFICEDVSDLEAVAREREQVARLSKILYARKEELDGVLKAHLKEHDELVLAGTRYRVFNVTSLEHPLDSTLALLGDATGKSRGELLERVATVDKKALEAVLKELGKAIEKPRLAMLKAELEARANKRFTPRLWAKEA